MEIKQELAQVQERPETFEDIRKDAEARFRKMVEAWMLRRSTFGTTLGAMQAFNNVFDRIEAAHKRELPQRDPDWAEICTKCHDGESPEDCEYFGEPNGCNSPIYGQHPNAKPCGNSAALREALKRIVAASIVAKNANAPEWILQQMADIFAMATTALAAPPRNCDVGTAEEQTRRFADYCARHRHTDLPKCAGCPLEDLPSGTGCVEAWAQRPYEEGSAK